MNKRSWSSKLLSQLFFVVLLTTNVVTNAVAQNSRLQINKVDLKQLSWLEGCWEGKGLGGDLMSCAFQNSDGRLVGMFQISNDGTQLLSQIYILDNFETGPALRVKHFNSDFIGWEEKESYVEFKIISISRKKVEFENLSYELNKHGRKIVTILTRNEGGEIVTEALIYHRVDLSSSNE